jgi:hypothetical protein
MKISVVMVDGSFRERFHIVESLSRQTLTREDYEIIWVEFYDDVNDEIKNNERVKVITLNNASGDEYHSSFCFNEGIRSSKGEIMVIPDADVMVEPTFLESVLKEHEECDRLVMYFNRLNEDEEDHTEDKSYDIEYLKKVGKHSTPGNFGGCLSVRKKWLLEINGYDQDPVFATGAHANGHDVYTRLKNHGLHVMWHPVEMLYHPWHPYPKGFGDNYDSQRNVVTKRGCNLTTLPNYGLDPSKDKETKEFPDKEESSKGLISRIKKITTP